jgi:hypothetical protein
MRYVKKYLDFKESIFNNITSFGDSLNILESLKIWSNAILSSILATEVDIYKDLQLDREFYKNRLDIDFLFDNIEFINALTSLSLKKSNIQLSDDYETFIKEPIKWMFIYDITSNELENPVYMLLQTWENNKWSEVKLFKINGNIKNFYDKICSKTIEIIDNNDNYIYLTSDSSTWELQTPEKKNDIYKKFLNKEEFHKLLLNKNIKINII